jgi:hypothetical protein
LFLGSWVTLIMEAIFSPRNLFLAKATRRHNPEDGNLHEGIRFTVQCWTDEYACRMQSTHKPRRWMRFATQHTSHADNPGAECTSEWYSANTWTHFLNELTKGSAFNFWECFRGELWRCYPSPMFTFASFPLLSLPASDCQAVWQTYLRDFINLISRNLLIMHGADGEASSAVCIISPLGLSQLTMHLSPL